MLVMEIAQYWVAGHIPKAIRSLHETYNILNILIPHAQEIPAPVISFQICPQAHDIDPSHTEVRICEEQRLTHRAESTPWPKLDVANPSTVCLTLYFCVFTDNHSIDTNLNYRGFINFHSWTYDDNSTAFTNSNHYNSNEAHYQARDYLRAKTCNLRTRNQSNNSRYRENYHS